MLHKAGKVHLESCDLRQRLSEGGVRELLASFWTRNQEPAPRSAALPHPQPVSLIWRREERFCPLLQPYMSCDLQRIVPTFVPSFDPLLTDAPEPSDLISGATQLRRPTLLQLHRQNRTPAILPFLPKSGRVNELLPRSYAPPLWCSALRVF